MGFFNDVFSVIKDVGTSVTRIVTDSVIDLANVATGFQFNDEMGNAKKKMSEVGINSASEAIERNHYGFLKDMKAEGKEKYDELTALYNKAEREAGIANSRSGVLKKMLNDISFLLAISKKVNEILERLRIFPGWKHFLQKNDIQLIPLEKVSEYETIWGGIGKQILRISYGTNIASGTTALGSIGMTLKAANSAKAAKFVKIGKMAGKAAVVLTVASVGLDIGLSIAELEKQREQLESYLRDVNNELARADREITGIRQKRRTTELMIDRILNSIELQPGETGWEEWFSRTQQEIEAIRDRLITLDGALESAKKLIEKFKDMPVDDLVDMVLLTEPLLDETIVRLILKEPIRQ